MHEIGHLLGIGHAAADHSDDLMADELETGMRRNPTNQHAAMDLASEDKLEAGLDVFGTWAAGMGTAIDAYLQSATQIPFTGKNLASIMGLRFGDFGNVIPGEVKKIENAVAGYFDTAPDPNANDLVLALQNIEDVTITREPGSQQFNTSISLTEYNQSILLDMESLELDLNNFGIDLEVPLPFGFSVTQSQPLELDAGVNLDFAFGIDGEGEFFVLEPELKAFFTFGEDQHSITQVIPGTEGNPGTAGFVIAGDASTAPGVSSPSGTPPGRSVQDQPPAAAPE